MKNITAIVVIFNGMQKQWIQKCFDSLMQSSVKIDIIAIDNNSSDTSVDYIKKNYQEVKLIESKINLGFGGANNKGIELALSNGAEHFFLLNQDAWVQEKTIEILVQNSINNPEYGILSPLHMNGDGNLIDQGFYNCINPFKSRELYSRLFTQSFNEKTILNFDFVPAACWLLPKSTIMSIGGFSPTFFHYGEDDNYVNRSLYHKLKIGIIPSVQVYHDREERPPHIYFDSLLIKYERKIVLDISNPLLNGNRKLIECRLLLSDLFRSILFFDGKSIKLVYNKYKKLVNIKTKELLKNKKISEKKGMSFLS